MKRTSTTRTILACTLGLLCQLPAAAQERNPQVIMDTSLGQIRLELFADKAPVSVKNFLQYVDDKFYDGLVFHRVIAGFMIQGGGMDKDLTEKPGRDPIKNEAGNGLANARGTLAVARTSVPDSGTSQFYINLKDNAFLDRAKAADKVGYAVFGKVVEGMDIVDKIARVQTQQQGGHSDVPVEPVVIRSVRRANEITLATSGSPVPGKTITITAQVDFPSAGQALTLVLPDGLELIEGKEIQPVPASSPALVLWRLRAVDSGEYVVRVRSNAGTVLRHTVRVSSSAKIP
jgi:peptidyl-prolyl cis-trans isomerase B (cyclophilin B)